MAEETLKIEAIIEGADTEALKRMRSELDNLSASTARHGAQSRTAAASTDVLDRSLNRTWQTAKGVAVGLGLVFSVQAITSFASSSVQAFGQYEQAMQRVVSAAGILGESEDLVRFKIAATTDELQKRTTFGNEQQMDALNSLILSTQDYDRAMSTLPITLDVAAAHGLDAATAGRMVGMALEGNTSMIGRYVPALRGLSEEEKNVANISRILEETYRGRAEAMAQTTTGQLQIMKNEWGDLKRTVGGFLLFMAGDFARSTKDIVQDLNLIGGGIKLAEGQSIEAGLAALPFLQKQQEELRISPMFRGPIPQAMHELDLMRQMSPLAFQRLKLEQEITAELQKGGAKYESIVEKAMKILDLLDKEKKVRQEIAQLQAQGALSGFQEFGGFAGAAEEINKKLRGALGRQFTGANLRLGGEDRFLSMGDIVGRTEGVSHFSMRQEQALQESLKRENLPQAFRAQTSEQLFNLNVQQMREATTPGMAGAQFSQSIDAFNQMQRAKEAQLTEEINDRKKQVENAALSADELVKIRGLMEQLVSRVKVNPKGFGTLNRNELE